MNGNLQAQQQKVPIMCAPHNKRKCPHLLTKQYNNQYLLTATSLHCAAQRTC